MAFNSGNAPIFYLFKSFLCTVFYQNLEVPAVIYTLNMGDKNTT